MTGAATAMALVSDATDPMAVPCSRSDAALEIRLWTYDPMVKPRRLNTTMAIIIQPSVASPQAR